MRAIVSDQRLVAITGQVPLVDWQTTGTTAQSLVLDSGAVAATTGRTIYTVWYAASLPTITSTGVVGTGIVVYGTNNDTPSYSQATLRVVADTAGSTRWSMGQRVTGGIMVGISFSSNPLTVGTRCESYGLVEGGGRIWFDQTSGNRSILDQAGAQFPHSYLMTSVPNPADAAIRTKGQRTVIFSGVHPPATSRKIRDWLLRSTNLS